MTRPASKFQLHVNLAKINKNESCLKPVAYLYFCFSLRWKKGIIFKISPYSLNQSWLSPLSVAYIVHGWGGRDENSGCLRCLYNLTFIVILLSVRRLHEACNMCAPRTQAPAALGTIENE